MSNDSISLSNLKNYNVVELFEYKLYYSDTYDVTVLDENNIKYMMIGYSLDIRDSSKNNSDILEMLHNSKSVIEDLEYISGRYIYIKAVSNELYVYSDASQLLPLVFNKEAKTLASHDNLLAEVLNDNNYKLIRRPLEVHNELDFTRYEEIQKFNPSMRLRTRDFSYRRIYPRIQLKTASIESVYNTIEKYFEEMIKWLQNNQQLKILSVTGGIDSRVSASLTRTIDNIEFLTYYMPDEYIKTSLAKSIYAVDRNITTEMKDNMRWNHSIIDLTEIPLAKEELDFYESYYNSKHGYRLDKYYREYKNYHKALHIKSTVFGMGKGDFPTTLDAKSSDLNYYKKSVHGINKNFEKHYNVNNEIEKYFERNLVDTAVTKGRHYFDLYHLESRMGNWHSTLTLETDPETEEFIFTNSRKIIDLIQLPTIAEKRNYSLYKEIVRNYWPVLLFFGINESDNLYEQTTELLKSKLQGLSIYRNRNLEVIEQSNSISINPKNAQISLEKNYNFIIENLENEPKKITIESEYSKEEARGLVRVLIRQDGNFTEYDVLDFNNGKEIEITNSPISVNIFFNKEYNNKSWKKAGKLIIKE